MVCEQLLSLDALGKLLSSGETKVAPGYCTFTLLSFNMHLNMGLNPVEAPKIFFGLNCKNCLNPKHNCDDHTFITLICTAT